MKRYSQAATKIDKMIHEWTRQGDAFKLQPANEQNKDRQENENKNKNNTKTMFWVLGKHRMHKQTCTR